MSSRMLPLTAAIALLASPAGADEPEPPIEWRAPVSYSLAGMGVGFVALVGSRQGDDDPRFANFKRAFGNGPRRDDDSALYNLVLHPLWGSETYLRAREANMGVLGSFAFSLGASVAWEYLIESWTEHPSSQDLIFTTGIGWALGEVRHQLKQRLPEEKHPWVDPVHTALGRMGLGFVQPRTGGRRLGVSYSF